MVCSSLMLERDLASHTGGVEPSRIAAFASVYAELFPHVRTALGLRVLISSSSRGASPLSRDTVGAQNLPSSPSGICVQAFVIA